MKNNSVLKKPAMIATVFHIVLLIIAVVLGDEETTVINQSTSTVEPMVNDVNLDENIGPFDNPLINQQPPIFTFVQTTAKPTVDPPPLAISAAQPQPVLAENKEASSVISQVAKTEEEPAIIEPPPLIPRKIIFSTPDYANVRLNPTGQWVAWIAAYDNVPNIWGKLLPDGEPKPLTKERGRGIYMFYWNYDNRTILYPQDKDGDENWCLFLLDINTLKSSILTETLGVKAVVLATSSKRPHDVVIGLNNRDPRYHDIYLIDLISGNETLIFQNNKYKSFVFDHDLNIRLVVNETEEGGETFYKFNNGTVTLFESVSFEDSDLTGPVYFHANGKVLYWLDSINRDKNALFAIDMETDERKLIFESNEAEISSVIGNPVISVLVNYMKPVRVLLDKSITEDLEIVRKNMPDEAEPLIISYSSGFKVWVIIPTIDNTAPSYYFFNRSDPEKRVKFMFNYKQSLKSFSMVHMHAMEIPTRDGLKQVCYLSLPLESDPQGLGLPLNPLPTILLVHGGPWSRDKWGFDEKSQYYANRGYAVLQCNYRGSSGFGKKFSNAGNGEWGSKMQNDLTDAVYWAINNNVSDPDKIGIVGNSYGGYAVLAGLTFTPDLYACGVDIVGPSNLVTLMKAVPPYWKPVYNQLIRKVGADPYTPEGQAFLKSRSPLFYANRIKKPLLIAQGANDPKVKQIESDQIVEALANHSIPVTYLVFPNEGHGFNRFENRLAFYAISEKFLAECLGGRAEPILNDMAHSTVQLTVYNKHH